MFNADGDDTFGYMFQKNDPLHSLNNFATSLQANDRENYPRVLEHIIQTQPYVLSRDYKEILSTLDLVSNDSVVSVRTNLSSWLQRLCVSCLEREQQHVDSEFSRSVLEKVLNITVRYLTDEPGIRSGAYDTLSYLIERGFLDKATTEDIVCPVVERLSRKPLETFDEELYAIYIHLMVKIVPIVGYAKTYELVYNRFVEMCSCKEHFVRRECATAFPVMCEVLGDELFEKSLLPIFIKLCDDEIWTVRRACAEVMPIIALLCTLEKRRKVLVPAMKKFMFDPSQWVIMAALKNLGQFLTTFAQLRILGLAYNSNLELRVSNAADRSCFVHLDTSRITYGNQPSADALIKNFETYEKRFREAIQKYALLSLVKSNEEPWKARGDDTINVEVYLYSIAFADRRSQRLSTGSNSDDGGISKISDFSYKLLLRKSLSSSSLCAPPVVPVPTLHRGAGVPARGTIDEMNPLTRFLRYCSPMKNNFADAFTKQQNVNNAGDMDRRGSDSDDNHGGWGIEDDGISSYMEKLDEQAEWLNYEYSGSGIGSGKSDVVPRAQESEKQPITAGNSIEGVAASEDESIDPSFNSHQFWYISPEMPLDLDFIDDDTSTRTNMEINKNTDISNNNVSSGSAPIATDELGDSSEDSKNNNPKHESTPNVTQEHDPHNDSDSSYGSINNNSEADVDVERVSSTERSVRQKQPQPSSGSFHQKLDHVTAGVAAIDINKEGERLRNLIRWQNEEVEWNLLEDFVHMKNIKELCFECAYYFPAVVLTFGDKFWPILSNHFFALCNDIQNTVRRTMASSISKIALIIGREHATRDLVAPYIEFLMDSDEIRIEVINSLAEFIRVIDGSEHETLMDQLSLCLQPPLNMMNWRFREAVARQLVPLVRMHTKIRKENCLLYLTGLAMRLMVDKYDSVRKAGMEAFIECSREFQRNDLVFKFFTENFAHGSNWRRRQTYIVTAGKILETGEIEVEIFRKHLLGNVLSLAGDPVPNVRIQVAKCLKDIILPHPIFSDATSPDAELVEQALGKLRSDPDRDVRGHIDGYQSTDDDLIGAGAPEITATASTIDTASTSSTSSTSSLSPPPSQKSSSSGINVNSASIDDDMSWLPPDFEARVAEAFKPMMDALK
ncbi:serine/threonine-protein phosphatase 4 regulatory subunit 1-like isoform X2 [Uranotaenia lowii]|uniref:serine/threonine-protein phosphatase 4 regulatory subunit 1-like isoform X2 n=1 Tax=Uranotaenia lowii TaxID=190385 RepID=UPI00247AE90B|nr:serine/threonine-protein phosphatase 4 regulatory subunit 1-like isoform X2 [Uranotaenia lowii]